MVSIAGVTIAELFVWLGAAYVLWLQLVLLITLLHANGRRSTFDVAYARLGPILAAVALVGAGWLVLFVLFSLPIPFAVVCSIDGALLAGIVCAVRRHRGKAND